MLSPKPIRPGSLVLQGLLFLCLTFSAPAQEPVLALRQGSHPPVKLTLSQLQGLPLLATNVIENRKSVLYEGVPVYAVLQRAGGLPAAPASGKPPGWRLLVTAADSYSIVFTSAELSSGKLVLLAFRRDGAALDAHFGPLQLVVPDEVRHTRWVRRVAEMEILPDR